MTMWKEIYLYNWVMTRLVIYLAWKKRENACRLSSVDVVDFPFTPWERDGRSHTIFTGHQQRIDVFKSVKLGLVNFGQRHLVVWCQLHWLVRESGIEILQITFTLKVKEDTRRENNDSLLTRRENNETTHRVSWVKAVATTWEWMNKWKNGWMNEWMNKWMNEWMNKWMNERMDGWISSTKTPQNNKIFIMYTAHLQPWSVRWWNLFRFQLLPVNGAEERVWNDLLETAAKTSEKRLCKI